MIVSEIFVILVITLITAFVPMEMRSLTEFETIPVLKVEKDVLIIKGQKRRIGSSNTTNSNYEFNYSTPTSLNDQKKINLLSISNSRGWRPQILQPYQNGTCPIGYRLDRRKMCREIWDIHDVNLNSEKNCNQKSYISTVEHNLSIQLRNERERNRVRAVNEAFAKLRKMVPYTAHRSKRISKVKTLQKAVQYIAELKALLNAISSNRNN